jgi:hypothetical protein
MLPLNLLFVKVLILTSKEKGDAFIFFHGIAMVGQMTGPSCSSCGGSSGQDYL